MTTSANKIFVYFAAFEFGDDPSVVTSTLGIAPTKAWVKGDPIPGSSGIRRRERWVLESALAPGASIENQIADLLPQLETRRESVLALGKLFRVAFRIAAYFHDTYNPSWELSADVIRRLAALGLLADFDIYCLGNGDGDEHAS